MPRYWGVTKWQEALAWVERSNVSRALCCQVPGGTSWYLFWWTKMSPYPAFSGAWQCSTTTATSDWDSSGLDCMRQSGSDVMSDSQPSVGSPPALRHRLLLSCYLWVTFFGKQFLIRRHGAPWPLPRGTLYMARHICFTARCTWLSSISVACLLQKLINEETGNTIRKTIDHSDKKQQDVVQAHLMVIGT